MGRPPKHNFTEAMRKTAIALLRGSKKTPAKSVSEVAKILQVDTGTIYYRVGSAQQFKENTPATKKTVAKAKATKSKRVVARKPAKAKTKRVAQASAAL